MNTSARFKKAQDSYNKTKVEKAVSTHKRTAFFMIAHAKRLKDHCNEIATRLQLLVEEAKTNGLFGVFDFKRKSRYKNKIAEFKASLFNAQNIYRVWVEKSCYTVTGA
jgi:hypothetical protein